MIRDGEAVEVRVVDGDKVLAVGLVGTCVLVAIVFAFGFQVGSASEAKLSLGAFGREAYAWGLLEESIVSGMTTIDAGARALRICKASDAALEHQLGQFPTPLPAPSWSRITEAGEG